MGAEINQQDTLATASRSSILLELAALDDLDGFITAVEQSTYPIDEPGLWYTRRIGSNKMSYEPRTPLMVASQYGSTNVLDYILRSGQSNINGVSGSDRVTALHCAVAGGSDSSPLVVDRLIAAAAAVDSLDGTGRTAADLMMYFPKFKKQQRLELETLMLLPMPMPAQDSPAPVPAPVPVLPDINNGVYGTDEFRMYCFKIVPCSRAYTHDWTECPFAHPGENAKRRDPKKHQYTCVPCPEFKKGTCKKGDDCEFAHGVFESWLHPAQYRTRLCKDETGCSRKVCFFAHKKEELRPVYQSTGSAIPGLDMTTPPLSPSFSPKGNYSPMSPKASLGLPLPSLQLPGSRLRTSMSARDLEFERELMKMEHQFLQQQQQILSPRPSPRWSNGNVPRKLSSPPRVVDSSPKSVAAAMLNSRAAAFARSQSFIDRAAPVLGGGYGGSKSNHLSSAMSANLSDWGSPNGKLDWGIKGEELHKLRKSNSFGFRGSANGLTRTSSPPGFNEPDVSWVNSLVKDEAGPKFVGHGGAWNGVQVQAEDMRSPWVEQLYIEQEQLVA